MKATILLSSWHAHNTKWSFGFFDSSDSFSVVCITKAYTINTLHDVTNSVRVWWYVKCEGVPSVTHFRCPSAGPPWFTVVTINAPGLGNWGWSRPPTKLKPASPAESRLIVTCFSSHACEGVWSVRVCDVMRIIKFVSLRAFKWMVTRAGVCEMWEFTSSQLTGHFCFQRSLTLSNVLECSSTNLQLIIMITHLTQPSHCTQSSHSTQPSYNSHNPHTPHMHTYRAWVLFNCSHWSVTRSLSTANLSLSSSACLNLLLCNTWSLIEDTHNINGYCPLFRGTAHYEIYNNY